MAVDPGRRWFSRGRRAIKFGPRLSESRAASPPRVLPLRSAAVPRRRRSGWRPQVHRSSTYAFRGGHEHRRINVVLLFGANRRLNPKNDNVMRSRIDVEPPGPGFVKGAF